MDELTPRGELRATNPSATNRANVTIPICGALGTDTIGALVKLLADLTAELYGSVAAARTFESKDGKVNYRIETIIASSAIAATEAEAVVILCSVKRYRVAEIHIRALAEIARRVNVIYREPGFAKAIFDSLQQSRRALVEKVPTGHPAREFVLRFLPRVVVPTMRSLERKSEALFKKHLEGGTVSAYELEAWSKWQHGEIVALADAADAVRESRELLQEALHCSSRDDFVPLLHRACGFVLHLLYVLSWLGVQDRNLEEFLKRFASFSGEIAAKTEALRKMLAGHESEQSQGER